MPEIVHGCGKKLKFPPGSEGRKGKCPTCGQTVEVPRAGASSTPPSAPPPSAAAPPSAAPPQRSGLAPALKLRPSNEEKIEFEPPPSWEQYQAFLDGRGPAPRLTGIPANIMLKIDADAAWKRAEDAGPPSKFNCPGCKNLNVGDMVCLGCGLDLRTGHTLDGEKKLPEGGVEFLKKIPWLKDAPPPEVEPGEEKKKPLGKPKRPKRRLRG